MARRGLEEGLQKGRQEALEDSARRMLKRGLAWDQIAEFTGISIEKIEKMAKD